MISSVNRINVFHSAEHKIWFNALKTMAVKNWFGEFPAQITLINGCEWMHELAW